jgi:hypothetical protein
MYWFDFGDGATDLWLDYARSVNLDGTELPVIGTIVVDNINPLDGNLRTIPTRFTDSFAVRGGLTVTPDELLSSLNPEYMLDLAKRRIGTSPDISAAEALMGQKEYLESLLASRRALRTLTGSSNQTGDIPSEYRLYQSYPNPFNPSTTIEFHIPEVRSQKSEVRIVTLKVYSMLGQEVATLVNEELNPGSYRVTWDAAGLPRQTAGGLASGVYFYRLQAGEFIETRKLLLVR